MELQTVGKLMTVSFIILSSVSLKYYGLLQKIYPDLRPLAGFADQFRVAPCTLVGMMKFMWGNMCASVLFGFTMYLRFSNTAGELFPMGYHLGVQPIIYTTTPWLFLLGLRKFVAMAVVMAVSACCFLLGFVSVLKSRAKFNPALIPQKVMWFYDLAVLDGLAGCTNWYFHSTVYFGTVAIAYKEGHPDEVMPSGLCDPAEGCGYYLLPIYVLFVLGWIVSDTFLWPRLTNRVKFMYPCIMYVCIGILLNSPTYRETDSLLPILTSPGMIVHKTYMVLTVIAFMFWLFRVSESKPNDRKVE